MGRIIGWAQAAWARWQTSRMFCDYCGLVPVEQPGAFCSDDCLADAVMEDRAA